jgi:TonB family protein
MAHTLRNSRAGWAFWLALLVAAVVGSMTAQRPEVAIQQPKLIQKVDPEYPPDVVRSRLEGKVLIRFTVDTAGVPRDLILVESSHPVFIEPAMAAVRQWRFEPGRVSGKPYDLPALAELRFQASKAGSGAASEERRDSLGPKVMDPTTPAQVPTPHPGSKESVSSSGAVAEIAKKTNERDVEFFDTRITGADGAFRLRTENFFLVSDLKDDDQLGQVLLALERALSLSSYIFTARLGTARFLS